MPITVKEIYWLAGLLDGEGCFSETAGARLLTGRGPTSLVQLTMTDRDTVQRAAHLLGYPGQLKLIHKKPPRKVQWAFRLVGRRAVGTMMTIYSLMSDRRQARIRELLRHWRLRPWKSHGGDHRTCRCGKSFIVKSKGPNDWTTGRLCHRCWLNHKAHLKRLRDWGITDAQQSLPIK